jgi:hypothetical protein
MTILPFPNVAAIVARQQAARYIRRLRLSTAQLEYEQKGYGTWHAKRAALLQLCARSRLAITLADSVRDRAIGDLIAAQDELVAMRRQYYAEEL